MRRLLLQWACLIQFVALAFNGVAPKRSCGTLAPFGTSVHVTTKPHISHNGTSGRFAPCVQPRRSLLPTRQIYTSGIPGIRFRLLRSVSYIFHHPVLAFGVSKVICCFTSRAGSYKSTSFLRGKNGTRLSAIGTNPGSVVSKTVLV